MEVHPKYDVYGEHLGGYLKDVPEPHIRMFPNDEGVKRPVVIHINRYYGMGRHYFASVDERDNPIWDESVRSWRFCWDDDDKRGQVFTSPRCLSIYWARRWVEDVLAKHFPSDMYEYRWQDYTQDETSDGRPGRPRWFYREGD